MDLSLRGVLLMWEWRPEVTISLGMLALLYGLGWQRLRRRGAHRLANGWRLVSYYGGILALVVALLSAVDALQSLLFTMHMVQHLLLTMVAAPLIVLANPFPIVLWSFPREQRRAFSLLLARGRAGRRLLVRVTHSRIAWALFVGTFVLWHAPTMYEAALYSDIVHDIEHISFFVTALLFWWHITQAPPRVHGRLGYGARIALLAGAFVINEALSVALAFASSPWYSYYTTVPRIWGLSALADQKLGGAIMWVPGGMMYVVAIVVLLARLLDAEEKKPPLPEGEWATEDVMRAPGWQR